VDSETQEIEDVMQNPNKDKKVGDKPHSVDTEKKAASPTDNPKQEVKVPPSKN
jgi:hypothetical protein